MEKAFLGVVASLTGRRWVGLPPEQERLAAAIALETGQPEILGRILARSGVVPEKASAYLEPMLRDLMPDPSSFRDMDKAAERFATAVAGGERIAVFADYDVDGGASAALVLTWLRAVGQKATLYIPDRIDEGYGPNEAAMAGLGRGHDLIVCVDCGTQSFAPIAAAGCAVIVLDHHLGGETLPPALAVVNPNRQDESGDFGNLCAAGVVFLFLAAVNRLRRAQGLPEPDLRPMLDLVALATVADVAMLTGFNRALVRQGLKIMAQRGRPGLAALADVARLTSAPAAWHLGFMLGPRVNAGGRIGASDLGARLLATDDPAEAAMLAEKLDRLNTERRAIEAGVLEAALAQAEARGDGPLAWAAGEGWHPGVVGIVAARLKEATGRPSVVIGLDGDEGKGSGRSVSGIDLGSALAAVQREGLLLKGGGHRMAAGLTVARDRLEAAMARLGELLARQGAGEIRAQELHIDGLLGPAAATADLIALLEKAGPFGQGAPAPRFAFAGMRVVHVKPVGADHLQLGFSDGSTRLDAILFRASATPLGEALRGHDGRAFHLAGHLDLDEWQGRRRAKLRLEDAAFAG